MGYFLEEKKREKPLVVAWSKRRFHGKISDEQFLIVCGGVCPVSHPSPLPHSLHCSQMDQRSLRTIELGTQVSFGRTRMAHVDSKSERQGDSQHPGYTKDGSNSVSLEEFKVYRGARYGKRALLGTV